MTSRLKILQKIGIEHPIWLSPMAGVSTIDLAAAVTNNGGLGSIPLATIDFIQDDGVSKLNQLIEQYGKLITKSKNTVNLNFFCHEIERPPNTIQIDNWKTLYDKTLGVQDVLEKAKFTNGNVSFKEIESKHPVNYNLLLEYLENLKPKIVSFHFGIASDKTISRLQRAGVLVVVTSTSLDETKTLVERGVDGIVLQGYEAGGHRGNFLTTSALDENLSTHSLFQVLKEYINGLGNGEAPFLVAAGGIGTGETIKYYLSQGADAVQLGTAFLATPESVSSKFFTSALNNTRTNTIMIDLVSGKTARTVRTKFIDDLITQNDFKSNELPGYGYSYNAYKSLKPLVDQDIGFYLAGQNYYQIEKNKLAEQVIQGLINELQ